MRWRALVAVTLVAQVARADGPAAADAAMQQYFAGEQAEGYAWFALGAPALAVGGALAQRGGDGALGAGIPLLAFGAIQLAAGLWLIGVTEPRVAGLRRELADGAPVVAREAARMRGVERSFVVLRWSEIALAAAGAATGIAGAATGRDLLTGIGFAVAVESAIMLLLDGLAARRARRYAAALTF